MAYDARLYGSTEIERAREPRAFEEEYRCLLERCEELERERDRARDYELGMAYLMVGLLVGLVLVPLACLA